MKKILSIILILVALFGIVMCGFAVKDTLDTKDHYEKAGEENDKNMQAYKDNLAQLEQAGQLLDGVDQIKAGYGSWQEGYNGLKALGAQAGIEAPSAENVATYDAVIEQAGIEELKGVPQAIADGQKTLAEGLTAAVNGVMGNEETAAGIEQASGMTADQINETVAALPAMPYDQFDGTVTTLLNAADPIVAGVKQQFEAGLEQFQKEGVEAVLNQEPYPGLTSIKDRLGEDFKYLKDDGTLDLEAAKKVSDPWKAYSDDSGDAISKEVWTRVVGIALILIASLLALFVGIKGNKLLGFVAALLACAGFVALLIAGSYYTKDAGVSSLKVTLLLVAGCAVAVMSLANVLAPKKK